MRTAVLALLTGLVPTFTFAQTTGQGKPFVRATGEGVVAGKPDQAKVSFAVVTEAANAADAAAQNATRSKSVLDALRNLLGPNADIRTSSYQLQPKYNYPRDGGTPVLNGFTAQNTVEVTLTDLSGIGKLLDGGIKAGANRIDGLQIGLKDEQTLRLEALRAAGARAKAEAEAIAAGLNSRIGALLAAEEGTAVRPVQPARAMVAAMAAAPPTPVEPGSVEVRATVTVEYELLPQ
jgi:uncharacterized protein